MYNMYNHQKIGGAKAKIKPWYLPKTPQIKAPFSANMSLKSNATGAKLEDQKVKQILFPPALVIDLLPKGERTGPRTPP